MAEKGYEVARVWSFSDDFAESPYIVKHGNRGWWCNCPQCSIRKVSCKHITCVRDFKKQPPEIQKKIKLSPEGMKFLKVTERDLLQLNLPLV
jgi:hypothetical protein